MGLAVELRGVSKTYKAPVEVHALKGVDLEVGIGELIVLMGPSGSGKSTLLNIVAGLDRPTSGTVKVLGRELGSMSERELDGFRLRNIGYLPQSYTLIPYLTALQNVALPLVALGVRKDLAYLKARLLLRLVGLGHAAEMLPSQMSGGMQQRAAIARALANTPRILMLDEPTSNVDADNASRILGIVAVVNRTMRTTVFLATHDPDAARIATRVIQIRDGRLYESAEPPGSKVEADVEGVAGILDEVRRIDEEIGLAWR